MCGLAVSVVGHPGVIGQAQIEDAARELAHRGPDYLGTEVHHTGGFSLGLVHTRLAIIDLSGAAHQPFKSRDGRWSLLFNGEIYNFVELRAELETLGCRFETLSDTEVLLQAWVTWGQAALSKFRGMFAFVVIDFKNRRLAAVRDSFGIKPLYYTRSSFGWSFASEISALQAIVGEKRNINHQTAYEYLAFGIYDRTQETFFNGLLSVTPGGIVEVDFSGISAEIRLDRWFTPPPTVEVGLSWEEAKRGVFGALRRSIEMQLRADVGLGIALSGGIDSSAIAAITRKIEPTSQIKTFSFVSPGSPTDESFWSEKVSKYLGTSPHSVSPSAKQVATDLEEVAKAQGEPFGSLSIYAQYAVYRAAKQNGLKVVLDGQGADEIFAGYAGYPEFRMRSLFAKGETLEAMRFMAAWNSFPGRSLEKMLIGLAGTFFPAGARSFGARLFGRSPTPSWVNIRALREIGVVPRVPDLEGYPLDNPADDRELVKHLAEVLFEGEMLNLLRHGDRNSMRWSVESRVPFLDLDLVSFVHSIPEEFLISKTGVTKNVLRHSLVGLLPNDVLFRRDKVGFAAPDLQWLVQMSSRPESLLEGLELIPWIRFEEAQLHLKSVWNGSRKFSPQVWRIINLAIWARTAA